MTEYFLNVSAVNANDNFANWHKRMGKQLIGVLPSPDVIVIAAAGQGNELDEACEWLGGNGYDAIHVPGSDEGAPDELLVAAERKRLARLEEIRFAGRWAVRASLRSGVSVIGVRLDRHDEELRVRQVTELLAATGDTLPVVAGDFSSLRRSSPDAITLRGLGHVLRPVSGYLPDFARNALGSAEGGAIAVLEQAGYRSADVHHLSITDWPQHNRIMVPKDMVIENFQHFDMLGLTREDAIVAEIGVGR